MIPNFIANAKMWINSSRHGPPGPGSGRCPRESATRYRDRKSGGSGRHRHSHPDIAAAQDQYVIFVSAHRQSLQAELLMTWVTGLAATASGLRFPGPASSSETSEPARVRRVGRDSRRTIHAR